MRSLNNRLLITVLVLACFATQAAGSRKDLHFGPKGSPLNSVRYAEIRVRGEIVETLPPLYVVRPGLRTTYGIVEDLERAQKDKSVDGVVLRVGRIRAGWGKVEEIRGAVKDVRAEGKEVVCFLQSGGELEFYLATAADRIVMRPSSSIMLTGLRAEVVFLKNMLDKVGVEAEMVQVGKYKGAAEPLTRTKASEPYKKVINQLLDGMYKRLTGAIAEKMGKSREHVANLVDRGPYTGKRAKKVGLVDHLMYYREYLRSLQKREKGPFTLAQRYSRDREMEPPLGAGAKNIMQMLLGMGSGFPGEEFPEGPTIAVLYAVGPIVRDDPNNMRIGDWVVNAERLVAYIRQLRKRENVRALVVRIDSAGGSAEASDMIWRALERTNEEKPVVASMSDVAASGGYYIASGGRYILADAGTLTGSIGVVGGKIVYRKLLDKLGVTIDVFQRGENAGLLSPVETFSRSEEERFRGLLEETYRIFLKRVSQSRQMELEKLRPWAQGRPLTGKQAVKAGLVDEIGGLQKAIQKARSEAGIPEDTDVSVVRVPRSESILKVLFTGRNPGVEWNGLNALSPSMLPGNAQSIITYLQVAKKLMENHTAAALLPMHIKIR